MHGFGTHEPVVIHTRAEPEGLGSGSGWRLKPQAPERCSRERVGNWKIHAVRGELSRNADKVAEGPSGDPGMKVSRCEVR